MTIHPCFKTKKVLQFVADLIVSYDYTDYCDLSEGDKYDFAALLIEAAGKGGQWECFTEHALADELLQAFKSYLMDNSSNNKERFLDLAKEHAVDYYDSTMRELFDYVLADYQQAENTWLGYMAKQGDPDEAYQQYYNTLS